MIRFLEVTYGLLLGFSLVATLLTFIIALAGIILAGFKLLGLWISA